MIGVYLVLAGAVLIGYEIYKGGKDEKCDKNGVNSPGSNHADGKRTRSKKSDRNRGLRIKPKKGVTNEGVTIKGQPDSTGNSAGNHHAGKPDSDVVRDNQEQSLKGETDGPKESNDNGSGDNGGHVSDEPVGEHGSDNSKAL